MDIKKHRNCIVKGKMKIYDVGNGKEEIEFEGKIFKDLKSFVDFIKLEYGEENLIASIINIIE